MLTTTETQKREILVQCAKCHKDNTVNSEIVEPKYALVCYSCKGDLKMSQSDLSFLLDKSLQDIEMENYELLLDEQEELGALQLGITDKTYDASKVNPKKGRRKNKECRFCQTTIYPCEWLCFGCKREASSPPGMTKEAYVKKKGTGFLTSFNPCEHTGDKIDLGDRNVYCGGSFHLSKTDLSTYDVIVTLSHSTIMGIWDEPSNFRGSYIAFPMDDQEGLPSKVFKDAQRQVYDLCKTKKVLIHCQGGHGRTGYFLAGLAHLALGMKDPISWVRKHYCSSAIESHTQVRALCDQLKLQDKDLPKAVVKEKIKPKTISSPSFLSGATSYHQKSCYDFIDVTTENKQSVYNYRINRNPGRIFSTVLALNKLLGLHSKIKRISIYTVSKHVNRWTIDFHLAPFEGSKHVGNIRRWQDCFYIDVAEICDDPKLAKLIDKKAHAGLDGSLLCKLRRTLEESKE